METICSTETSKLEFCAGIARKSKSRLVANQGIGSDITYVLIGWKNAVISAVAYFMDYENHEQREAALEQGAAALHRGFGADSFTLITDGYVHSDGGGNAAVRFANGDQAVSEALTLFHVDRWEQYVTCYSIPYTVKLGRVVEYAAPSVDTVEPKAGILFDLQAALDGEPWMMFNRQVLSAHLARYGVSVQEMQT